MNTDMNKYDIKYYFISQIKGTTIRHYDIYANSFGEAEKKFDEMFSLVNSINDDVYEDDVIYEIIDIEKYVKEEKVHN